MTRQGGTTWCPVNAYVMSIKGVLVLIDKVLIIKMILILMPTWHDKVEPLRTLKRNTILMKSLQRKTHSNKISAFHNVRGFL